MPHLVIRSICRDLIEKKKHLTRWLPQRSVVVSSSAVVGPSAFCFSHASPLRHDIIVYARTSYKLRHDQSPRATRKTSSRIVCPVRERLNPGMNGVWCSGGSASHSLSLSRTETINDPARTCTHVVVFEIYDDHDYDGAVNAPNQSPPVRLRCGARVLVAAFGGKKSEMISPSLTHSLTPTHTHPLSPLSFALFSLLARNTLSSERYSKESFSNCVSSIMTSKGEPLKEMHNSNPRKRGRGGKAAGSAQTEVAYRDLPQRGRGDEQQLWKHLEDLPSEGHGISGI